MIYLQAEFFAIPQLKRMIRKTKFFPKSIRLGGEVNYFIWDAEWDEENPQIIELEKVLTWLNKADFYAGSEGFGYSLIVIKEDKLSKSDELGEGGEDFLYEYDDKGHIQIVLREYDGFSSYSVLVDDKYDNHYINEEEQEWFEEMFAEGLLPWYDISEEDVEKAIGDLLRIIQK